MWLPLFLSTAKKQEVPQAPSYFLPSPPHTLMAAVILSNTRVMPTSYNKTIMSNLSLHRIGDGAGTNQATVIQKDYKFGHTAVNDWVIYEGAGPGPVFARGQGSHILAGNSISTIMITFEDPRYDVFNFLWLR